MTDQKKMTAEEIHEMICQIFWDERCIKKEEVIPEANLKDDLYIGSLDFIELIMEIEKEVNFAIEDEDLKQIYTVEDLEKLLMEKQKEN